MKVITFFLFLIVLVSCVEKREEVVEQTYPNGAKKIVMFYEGKDDTKRVVKQVSYYINGGVEVMGMFDENKKRTGNWVYYYENGNKWSECDYTEGVRNGKSITYYENGNKRYEGTYQKDKQIGVWKFYKEDGELTEKKQY